MEDSKKPDPTPPPETQEQRAARAETCWKEVQTVLAKHRCTIQPFVNPPERVGDDGSRMMVSAGFGVYPLSE